MNEKLIEISSTEIVTQVIPTADNIASQTVSELITQVPVESSLVLATNWVDTGIRTNLLGYGEESIPNGALFKRIDSWDSEIASTEILSLAINSVQYDQLDTSEQLKYSGNKVLIDQYPVIDQLANTFNKVLIDNAPYLIDFDYFSSYRDYLYLDFSLQDKLSIQAAKVLSDNATIQESFAKGLSIVKLDSSTVQDILITKTEFIREFSDLVVSTDDFYGEANIDDDQTALVGKVLLEQLTLPDEVSVALNTKLSTDFAYNSDTYFISINSNKVENISLQERIDTIVEKVSIDTVPVSEVISNRIESYKEDSYIVSDVPSVEIHTPKIDSISSSDENYIYVNKANIELVNTQETISLVANKAAIDVVSNIDTLSAGYTRAPEIEILSVVENVSILSNLAKLDTVSNTDLSYFDYQKVNIDQPVTLDTYSLDVSKALEEQNSLVDIFNYFANKLVLEDAAVQDFVTTVFDAKRIFEEINTVTDRLSLESSKPIFDNVAQQDTSTILLDKGLLENTNISLEKVVLDIDKYFSDLVVTTDDFYGDANIDDDQTALVDKMTIEIVPTIEEISFIGSFTLATDQYLANDYLGIHSQLVKSDQSNLSDSYVLSIGKSLVESINSTETISVDLNTVLTDSSSIQDIFAININSVYLDSNSLQDYIVIDTIKNIVDTNTLIETVNILIDSSKLDQIAQSDTSSWMFDKPILDSITYQEVLISSLGKVLLDTATNTDTLALHTGKIFLNDFSVSETFTSVADYQRVFDLDSISLAETTVFDASKALLEPVNLTETVSKDSSKVLNTDSFSYADEARLLVNKGLQDTSVLQDSYIIEATKGLVETIPLQEITSVVLDSILTTDSVTNSDYIETKTEYIRVFEEYTPQYLDPGSKYTVSDPNYFYQAGLGLFDENWLDFDKGVLDNITYQEVIVFDNSKVLLDTPSIAEVFTSKTEYIRNFYDTVVTTDDFYGEANIDDDQTAAVDKGLVELQTLQDQLSFTNSKVYAETLSIQEYASIQLSRPLEDSSNIQDSYYLLVNKAQVDTQTIIEVVSLQIEKLFVDSYSQTDLLDIVINKPFVENIIQTDYYTIYIDKAILENLAVIETVNVEYQKNLTENNTVSDIFNVLYNKPVIETTNIQEATYIANSKILQDSSSISEQIAKATNKPLDTDSYSVSDTVTVVTDYQRVQQENQYLTEIISKEIDTIKSEDISCIEEASWYIQKELDETDYFIESYLNTNQYTLPKYIYSTDIFELEYIKYIYESNNVSDVVALGLDKVFNTDTYSTLDSCYFEANNTILDSTIGTDSLASIVQKVLSVDTSTNTDQVSIHIQKSAGIDNYYTSDVLVLNTQKSIQDSVSNQDTISLYSNVGINDTTSTLETIQFSNQKILIDVGLIQEYIGLAVDKPLSVDTSSISDTININPQKSVVDQISFITETTRFDTQKQTIENLLLQEQVSFVNQTKLNQDSFTSVDQLSKLVQRPLNTDSTNYSDYITLSNMVAKTETVSITEVKTANIQSYFQSDFLQVGFVGTNLTL